MTSALETAIARAAGLSFGRHFLPATLTRETPGAPNPQTPWEPGAPVVNNYPCRAIHDEWGSAWLAAGLVSVGDAKLLILAVSLEVEPKPGDVVTITGRGTWMITGDKSVQTDPARAVWTCIARA